MTRRLDRRQFLMAAAGLVAAWRPSAAVNEGDEVVFVLDCSAEACGAIALPEEVEEDLEEQEEEPTR